MGKENADLLCAMLATRGELLLQLKGLQEETVRTRPEPKEWSVWEVLQHVANVDRMTVRRLAETEAGKPDLSAYNLDDFEAEMSAAEMDGLSGVLRRFYAARVQLMDAVSDLTAADLEKSGRHPRYGSMTARQLVEKIVEHDLDHAGQVARTRAVVEE